MAKNMPSARRLSVSAPSGASAPSVKRERSMWALPQGIEPGAQLRREELGLLPRREVPAAVHFVEVGEVAIGASCPCLRRAIDVLRKYRDGHRQRDLGGPLRARGDDASPCAVLPVEAGRGGPQGCEAI